jgi:radical SAM protein with 4Fe4S-binding SPASM domain
MINLPSPLVVRLETTYACNHRCPYCYKEPFVNRSAPRDIEKEGSLKRIIDLLSQWNVFDVTFTGGEPLTEKRLLRNLVTYLVDTTDLDYGINSNLSLMDDETARFLKETHIASMFVSFMTRNEQDFNEVAGSMHSYARVLKGFELLTKNNIKTTANMVAMKFPIDNVHDVYETARFLCGRFKISKFCIAPLGPVRSQDDCSIVDNSEVVLLLDQLIAIQDDFEIDVALSRPIPLCFTADLDAKYRKYDFYKGCTVGVANSLTLSPNGDVKPCPVWDTVIGNVFANSLSEVKDSLRAYDGTDKLYLSKAIPKECVGCELTASCKGGCKTESLALSGRLDGKSRYFKPNHASLTARLFLQDDLMDDELTFKERIRVRKDAENLYVVRGERFALLNDAEHSLFRFLRAKRSFVLSKELDLGRYSRDRLNLFLNKLMSARVFTKTKRVNQNPRKPDCRFHELANNK